MQLSPRASTCREETEDFSSENGHRRLMDLQEKDMWVSLHCPPLSRDVAGPKAEMLLIVAVSLL